MKFLFEFSQVVCSPTSRAWAREWKGESGEYQLGACEKIRHWKISSLPAVWWRNTDLRAECCGETIIRDDCVCFFMFVALIVDYLQKWFEQKFVLQETKFHVSVEDSFEWLWTTHFFEADHRKSGNLYKFILQNPGKLNSLLHILMLFLFNLNCFWMTFRLSLQSTLQTSPRKCVSCFVSVCSMFGHVFVVLQSVWGLFGYSTI